MKQMNDNDFSEQVVEFILTRDLEELSTLSSQKVGEVFGLNSSALSKVFKSVQHISLDRFIIREKMYRAFFIIERDRKISIKELAEEIGFFDIHQFIEEFEAFFLIHPVRYKELISQSH